MGGVQAKTINRVERSKQMGLLGGKSGKDDKDEGAMDKARGKAKEAFGALAGDEALKAEGRAEQRKADAEAEARQREKTRRAQEEARQAEKERDRQRLKDKGPLGGVTDAAEDLGGLTDKLTGR